MNKLLFIFFIFFVSIGIVSAGNNTTIVNNPTFHTEDADTVIALESGDSNISFSNNYKGYCIEWGEHSAEAGNSFYVHDNDVNNNIKVFFVYFYKESQKDTIATQHMIWKFTDNKEFSRFNQSLYNQIINKARTVQVPNEGTLKINNTTEMVYSFKNFISPIEEYQNYFGYRIFFRNISYQINNSTVNNITLLIPQVQNYTSNYAFNQTSTNKSNNLSTTSTSSYKKIVISSRQTGIKFWILIFTILLNSLPYTYNKIRRHIFTSTTFTTCSS